MTEQEYIKVLEQKMEFYENTISKQMEIIKKLFEKLADQDESELTTPQQTC